MPFDDIQLERYQREEMRWRILRTLDAGRPISVPEPLITRTLADIDLPATITSVRRELAYLEASGLVSIIDRDRSMWRAELTAAGVDVVEYTVKAPAGIARPSQV